MNIKAMKTIYKYPLAISDSQAVLMPINAQILSVQFQREDLCLWAVVDPEEKKHARVFHIVGTGHLVPPPEKVRFIGTVQQFNGKLVWHVFEQV
jgi:hypothetical protein